MNDKQRVAVQAAKLVRDGMLVGLGTGSTANYFIDALAQRHAEEHLQIQTVSSSVVSAIKAQSSGLPLLALEQVSRIDVYVDGADEVTADMTLLKGRGADLVREKLLAAAGREFWVLIDQSKQVEHIGQNFPVAIEVMPFAWRMVQRSLSEMGAAVKLRANAGGDGLAVSSYGSLILDAVFDPELSARDINDRLNGMPGIVEHGIFLGLATAVFCGHAGKVTQQSVSGFLPESG
ncbi:MAG: ribose-5-phosphate isomerase RpiA [Methylococcales bacterium]|nr:ribose-5-phosphate isomerase RpiA [Methylococcales bacterium]